MSRGVPYDSDAGRDYAATRSRRSCTAPATRSRRASRATTAGRSPATRRTASRCSASCASTAPALKDIDRTHVPKELFEAAKNTWDECVELGEQHGYRNAQATVLAPTGTIGFMMDCDTTGVEPDIALVKYKKLVGGGLMKIVNNTVPHGAASGSATTPNEVKDIIGYIDEHETIEGAPHLKDRGPRRVRLRLQAGAGRALHPLHGPHQDDGRGAAVHLRRDHQDRQRARRTRPSRRSSRPTSSSWTLGAKAVSIYRDGSKRTQPLNTSKDKLPEALAGAVESVDADAGRAAGCRTSGTRSPTSSTSPATRATSPSASTKTASRASCS